LLLIALEENPTMRAFLTFLTCLLLASFRPCALDLADISGKDAGGGLKEALTQGAGKAVDLLGKTGWVPRQSQGQDPRCPKACRRSRA
jgi:hypothetical protein